ncbi:MAG: hypothetical protein K0V04_16095 [Deltaproteobacteria bacterium]|nr:hypothetical protein [Deltaproteobacteria bacterium]
MRERLDPIAYRNRLRDVWKVEPGRYTGLAVVLMLRAMRDSMTNLRAAVGVGAWPLDTSAQARALRRWDRDFKAFSVRVDHYLDEIPPCWGEAPECWQGDEDGQTMVGYLDRWVTGPVLDGRHPEDTVMGVPWSPRPDAMTAAMLWNQLIEVEALQKQLRATSSHVGEWLLVTQRELSRSAPGESKTLADSVAEALGTIRGAVKTGWDVLKLGAAVVATGAVGVVLWRWRRRKSAQTKEV